MIGRVLVPLDGSATAEAALGHGVAIAHSLGAKLDLLRVVEAHAALTDPTLSRLDWRLHKVEAAAYLREIAARIEGEGLEVLGEATEGKPADEIVQFVVDRGIDLVVLATHGLGGARSFPFGGTVHKVLSCAPASMMVVRPAAAEDARRTRVGYRRLLVPVDGSPESEWALCLAASVARKQGADLVMLQVVPKVELTCARMPCSVEETELLDRLETLQHERGERYLREMESQLGSDDLRVRSRVVRAPQVALGIRQIAQEEGADLIALSAHSRPETSFPHGKVAQRLLARSEVPVLVFQDLPGKAWSRR